MALIKAGLRQARGAWQDDLVRSSVMIMVTTILTSLTGFAYWLLAARGVDADNLGTAAAGLSAVILLSFVSIFGVHSQLIKVLPSRQSTADWSRAVTAGLALAAVSGLVVSAIVLPTLVTQAATFRLLDHPAGYATLAAGVASTSVLLVLDYVDIAERRTGVMLTRNLGFAIVKLVLLVGVHRYSSSAVALLASWVIGGGLTACVFLPYLRRYRLGFSPRRAGLAAEIRELTTSGLGHHFINLGTQAPLYLLPIVVGLRLGPASAAWFFCAWRVAGLFFMVSPAVSQSLYAEGSHNRDTLVSAITRSSMVISLVLTPCAIVLVVFGRNVLHAFGPDYASHAYVLLLLLILSAVPDAVSNVGIGGLRVLGLLRRGAYLNWTIAATSLVLAWVLLPRYGLAGVGWSWIIAQSAGCLWLLGVHWRAQPVVIDEDIDQLAASESQRPVTAS